MSNSETKPTEEKGIKKQSGESKRKEFIFAIIMISVALLFAVGLSWGLQVYLDTDTPQVAVTTGSMEPVYHGYESSGKWEGDLLIVKSVSPSKYKTGDVIVFDAPGHTIPIVHRIIAIHWDNTTNIRYFKTFGDHNGEPDGWANTPKIPDELGRGWIHQEDINGRVIYRIPRIGWLALQLQEPTMKLILAITAIALLFWGFQDSEEDKEEEESNEASDLNDDQLEQKNANNAITNNNSQTSPKFKLSLTQIVAIAFIVIIVGFFALEIAHSTGNNKVELFLLPEEIRLNSSGSVVYPSIGLNDPIYENDDVYFIPCTLKISSNGLLNHINEVKITFRHSNGSSYTAYQWTIIYGFNGEKSAGIGLILTLNNASTGLYEVEVSGYSNGLLAGSTAHATYQINVVTI